MIYVIRKTGEVDYVVAVIMYSAVFPGVFCDITIIIQRRG